ncbi:MAG: TlpA family protein disulfide reductase [Cyclobacteriaceae bacterium]|nr:TlpA family protein disulfide reductase [Cyclobacteriaceae bacterium]
MKVFFKTLLLLTIFIPYQGIAQQINDGKWKGTIHYQTVEVPFNFNFENVTDSSAIVIIKNAEEQIRIENVVIKEDSLFIPMYVFDAVIKAVYKDGKMTGEWHKNYRKSKGPLFTAEFNQPRFSSALPKSNVSIENTWNITLTQPDGQTSISVGLFSQNKNKVRGSLLTETGDFRFFEGVIYGDSIRLSSFDGVHGFLMLGSYQNNTWSGVFHYENDYSEKWAATYDAEAKLTEPFSLITVKPNTHKSYYDILSAGGDYNAIDRDKLEGKVVIIQLMGTWCPNSLDQSKYLAQWYKKQNHEELALIAVTYEPGDKFYAQQRIESYTTQLNITYPMYIGGSLSKAQAALAFPNMTKINAFPTLVMIDRQGYIRFIDSYFNGPATGAYYQEFDKNFNERVEILLRE